MTPFDPQRDDADRLNDYLDDLAMGEPAPRSDIDSDLAKTVSQVHAGGDDAIANPHLKSQIWEDLMSTSYAADAGNVAAPIRSIDQIGHSRSGWMPAFAPGKNRGSRFALLAAAVAVFVLLSGVIYSAMQPGSPNPGAPNNNYAFLSTSDGATPIAWPEGSEYPPADDCTVPVVRVNEIVAIVQSSYEGWERVSSQRDFPLTPADNVPSAPPLPEGEAVDAETTTAIEQVYYTWTACANAGSLRQQFWLYSNDAIARHLAPNGKPILSMFVTLADEPAPVTEMAVPLRPILELRELPDGRVALIVETLGGAPTDDTFSNYFLFVEHNGNWYIDDYYCGSCG
jgi:hypothetical protein